jgi:hypothetical protein
VVATKQKGKKAPAKGTPDHFEKLLEGPCPNHTYHVKHLYKDCSLMKRFLSGGSKRRDKKKKPDPPEDDAKEKEGAFPETMSCLMIFSGTTAYDFKRYQKLTCREVYVVELAMPTFLRWSRSSIIFDRSDHPESVPHPSRYPLMFDPMVGMKRLTKVLMDGGNGLNIMYTETLDAMGIA